MEDLYFLSYILVQMTHYAGFDIDEHFNIYKTGRQVFAASWVRCFTLQEAKDTIDRSNASKYVHMPDKQAALRRMSAVDYVEAEASRREQQMEDYYEQQNEPNL